MFAFQGISQEGEVTRILFVLDASSSMKKTWESGTKWSVATRILTEIADSLNDIENVHVGWD